MFNLSVLLTDYFTRSVLKLPVCIKFGHFILDVKPQETAFHLVEVVIFHMERKDVLFLIVKALISCFRFDEIVDYVLWNMSKSDERPWDEGASTVINQVV